MKLIFIRHGEPDYVNDFLTSYGKQEAELLSQRLAAIPNIEGCYCSPLGRSKATAAPTCRALGMEPIILPWLQEFSGRITDPETGEPRIPWDLKPEYWMGDPILADESRWTEHPLMQAGNVAESYRATCEGMDELLARHGYRREGRMFCCEGNRESVILIFCHMAISMAAIGHLTGISPVLLWHHGCMPPSGVTTLMTQERQPGKVFFRWFQMGDTSHLYAGGVSPSRMAMFQEVYTGTDHTRTR